MFSAPRKDVEETLGWADCSCAASALVKWHDSPYQSLPDVYIQNASMEISMVATAMKGSISGDKVYGYLATGEAGFDLNHEYDWQAAEAKIFLGEAQLPKVTEKPWQT